MKKEANMNTLLEMAMRGDVESMYRLGLLLAYRETEDPTSDAQDEDGGTFYDSLFVSDRLKWLIKAAEAGHAMAAYHVGFCYQYFHDDFLVGIPSELAKEAVTWYQKAIELGNLACAKYQLAVLQQDRFKSYAEALKIYEEIADLYDDVYYRMGVCAFDVQRYEDADKYFLKSAERGYIGRTMRAYRYRRLGMLKDTPFFDEYGECALHEAEDEAEKDDENALDRALQGFIEAAEKGSVDAQVIVADCYRFGPHKGDDLTERQIEENKRFIDPEKAFYWYQMAAAREEYHAMAELGICYYEGIGTPVNYYHAYFWLSRAWNDSKRSKTTFGLCHKHGHGTWKNPSLAIKYLRDTSHVDDLIEH